MITEYEEIWKDIKGFEEFYEVSSLGRVRSKDRYYYQTGFGWRSKKGRILSPNPNGNGYLCVELRKGDGKRNRRYIHRLVAETFIENPNKLPQVDHIDYDRQNNAVLNLRWVTVSENAYHSVPNHPTTRPCYSSTGYKYIYFRKGTYRVCLYLGKDRGMSKERTFSELSKAIEYRDSLAKENGVVIDDN